jgi:hypothetical protein
MFRESPLVVCVAVLRHPLQLSPSSSANISKCRVTILCVDLTTCHV